MSTSSERTSSTSKSSSEWDGLPTPSTMSSKWRVNEAKNILNLLREEYKNSKSLPIFKRYKETERIIMMFTAEPVLQKLLHLTKAKVAEEEIRVCDQPKLPHSAEGPATDPISDTEFDESDDSVFLSSEESNSSLPQSRFLDKVVTTIFSRVCQTPKSPTILCSSSSCQSFTNDSGLDSPSDNYVLTTFQQDNSGSPCSSSNSPTWGLSSSHALTGFSSTAPEAVSASSNTLLSTRSRKYYQKSEPRSNSQPSTPRLPPSRGRMAPYILKEDQIPFQIPPQKKRECDRSSKTSESDMAPTSGQLLQGDQMQLRTNMSYPNIVDRFHPMLSGLAPLEYLKVPRQPWPASLSGSEKSTDLFEKQRSKSEHLRFIKPRMYQERDFFSQENKTENSYSLYAPAIEELNICLVHEQLVQLKKEYEALKMKGKNALWRYKKMKSMLKTVMALHV